MSISCGQTLPARLLLYRLYAFLAQSGREAAVLHFWRRDQAPTSALDDAPSFPRDASLTRQDVIELYGHVSCRALDPPVGGTFVLGISLMLPLPKTCPKMVSAPQKGVAFLTKDVLEKKFSVAGKDSAVGASASA